MKSDPYIQECMKDHYSQPKGFVGRQIIYKIHYDDKLYGAIAGGSATLHLPGRNEFLDCPIENIVNNTFYHIEKSDGKYPKRNFTVYVLKEFKKRVVKDWFEEYRVPIYGFESLVELPRTGELYLRDGWTLVGQTKGFTCKRMSEKVAGRSTDSWGGKRVWNYDELRPKLVFCCKWS